MKTKQIKRIAKLAAMLCPAFVSGFTATAQQSDSWALTDALGREVRGHEAVGPRQKDKFVGIFYWTWHQGMDHNGGKDRPGAEVRNITQVRAAHPEAMQQYNHPAWGDATTRPDVFYWNEPLFGYYRTDDPWVLRRHAEMLADAGVDAVFFDCTNGTFLWETSLWPLLETWDKAQKEGVNVPKVVFMLPFAPNADSRASLNNLYDKLYGKGLYKNLWFYWKGKPLIMAYPDNLDKEGKEGRIRNFFTFRPGQPDYVQGPQRADDWGWLEVMPGHGYVKGKNGRYEQAVVGIAQNTCPEREGHCSAFNRPNAYGRSYGHKEGFDKRPDAYLYGRNFQEQWDHAIDSINPELVFVTGWNEWTSGMWTSKDGWTDPLSFVDQYDDDHSRDIEPTRGWGDKGDVYYAQLVDNIRRFKGVAAPPKASAAKSVRLGNAADWKGVLPKYQAYRGNTIHRDHKGRYDRHYTNLTGRNDITGAQVAHDANNLYFHVTTASALTPASDPNWMQLYIDIDRDKSTGWNGYDFIVNRVAPGSSEVTVERCVGSWWDWVPAGTGSYAVKGNTLDIAIPKAVMGVGEKPDFEFKWADNLQRPGDILDFYVSGDVAPGGRFNYVYTGRPAPKAASAVVGTGSKHNKPRR